MSEATELKPCPFDGSPNLFVGPIFEADGPAWAVVCKECDINGPVLPSKEAAIEAWNTRDWNDGIGVSAANAVLLLEVARLRGQRDALLAVVQQIHDDLFVKHGSNHPHFEMLRAAIAATGADEGGGENGDA